MPPSFSSYLTEIDSSFCNCSFWAGELQGKQLHSKINANNERRTTMRIQRPREGIRHVLRSQSFKLDEATAWSEICKWENYRIAGKRHNVRNRPGSSFLAGRDEHLRKGNSTSTINLSDLWPTMDSSKPVFFDSSRFLGGTPIERSTIGSIKAKPLARRCINQSLMSRWPSRERERAIENARPAFLISLFYYFCWAITRLWGPTWVIIH